MGIRWILVIAAHVAVSAALSNAAPAAAIKAATSAPQPEQVFPAVGAAAGGTATTIFGQRLGETLSVTFGGVAATITLNTDGRIEVIAPAHAAGPVDVTVTNAIGSVTLVSAFTYYDAPVIASIDPGDGPEAGGNDVTVQGSNLDKLLTVTFGGVRGTVKSSTATRIVVQAPLHAPGAVQVRVTTVGGSDTIGYTYIAAPQIDAVSPEQGSTRGGYTVLITGVSLSDPATVLFGMAEAEIVGFSPTEIEVLAPPQDAAGTVRVVVITRGGTAIRNGAFSYVAAVGIDSVAPARGLSDGGETVTVLGSRFDGLQGVLLDETPALVWRLEGTTGIVIITPPGSPGLVDVTVRTDVESFTVPAAYEYVDAATAFGGIRGAIKAAGTNAPLRRAVVIAQDGGLVTGAGAADANGDYWIGGLEAGEYHLEVFAPGYHGDIANAVVLAGEDETIQFVLSPDTSMGTVSGRVIDQQTGVPLVGTRVQAIHSNGIITTFTCGDGSFTVSQIPLGVSLNVDVVATAQGFAAAEREVMIGTQNVLFGLSRGVLPGTISGSVSDARSGQKLKDARVFVTPVLGVAGHSTLTNATGGFMVGNLDYATYDLRVTAQGYSSHTQRVAVKSAGGVYVVVNMQPPSGGGPGCAAGQDTSSTAVTADVFLFSVTVIVLLAANLRMRRRRA